MIKSAVITTAAVAAFVAVALWPLASVQMTLTSSSPCWFESSTNLVDWSPWTNAAFTCTEPRRFFRGLAVERICWDRSPDTNVAGYRVWVGISNRLYFSSYDVGNVTNVEIPRLAQVTFFSVQAYGTNALSDYSNELITTSLPPVLTLQKN